MPTFGGGRARAGSYRAPSTARGEWSRIPLGRSSSIGAANTGRSRSSYSSFSGQSSGSNCSTTSLATWTVLNHTGSRVATMMYVAEQLVQTTDWPHPAQVLAVVYGTGVPICMLYQKATGTPVPRNILTPEGVLMVMGAAAQGPASGTRRLLAAPSTEAHRVAQDRRSTLPRRSAAGSAHRRRPRT